MDSITDILPNFIIDLLPVFILDHINLITFGILILFWIISCAKNISKAESLDHYKKENRSLNNKINNQKTNISKYKNETSQLQTKLASYKNSLQTQYKQNYEYTTKITDLEEKIKSLKQKIRSLNTQNRQNISDFKSQTLQIETLQQHNLKLQNDLNQAVSAKDTLEKELEEWKQEAENEGNYNKKHAHPRDKELVFDEEEHKYFVGNKELKSVTSLVEEYFPPFETERLAYIVGKKTGRNPQELIAEWDRKGEEARTLGTMMHANIEKFYLGQAYENNDVFGQFLDFTKETHLVPYRTEWPIYDEEAGIAGTLDFLDYQNGEYIIYD